MKKGGSSSDEDVRTGPVERQRPELVRRRENRKSTIKSGRTIGEARERLETANERAAARKKDKKKNILRIVFTILGFAGAIAALIGLFLAFTSDGDVEPYRNTVEIPYSPTIEVVDEDSAAGGEITRRMNDYIGRAEADFRALGLTPVKAVLPTGSIREVDFYLEGRPGFIKMNLDRDTAVSVEDAERMLRYLASIGVGNYSYIDVRIDQKAFWK